MLHQFQNICHATPDNPVLWDHLLKHIHLCREFKWHCIILAPAQEGDMFIYLFILFFSFKFSEKKTQSGKTKAIHEIYLNLSDKPLHGTFLLLFILIYVNIYKC